MNQIAPFNPIAKALWYIESRFEQEMSLDDVAEICGVSRFQLSRMFGVVTGHSVMRYIRGRRLSEAARNLAAGAPGTDDILTVALASGYGSHEAFTRAFRDQFGMTPEKLRESRDLSTLELVEPYRMDGNLIVNVDPPRIVDGKTLLIAGMDGRFTFESCEGIPTVWQRFGPHIGSVPGQMGKVAYGVCCNSDGAGSFDYIAGVEVKDFADLPKDFARIRIPPQKYAVFAHKGDITGIRATTYSIWNRYLPESKLQLADGPEFERYDERFDADSGKGVVEIWIPVKG
jgi:AraC family transcriptional regulator